MGLLNVYSYMNAKTVKLSDTYQVFLYLSKTDYELLLKGANTDLNQWTSDYGENKRIELFECTKVKLPCFKYKEESYKYGNFKRNILIPDYESVNDLELSLIEHYDNPDNVDSPNFDSTVNNNLFSVQGYVDLFLSKLFDNEHFAYKLHDYIPQIDVIITSNDFTNTVLTYTFKNLKLTNYSSYTLDYSNTSPIEWSLSFAFQEYSCISTHVEAEEKIRAEKEAEAKAEEDKKKQEALQQQYNNIIKSSDSRSPSLSREGANAQEAINTYNETGGENAVNAYEQALANIHNTNTASENNTNDLNVELTLSNKRTDEINPNVNYNLNFGLESSVTAGFVNLPNNTVNNESAVTTDNTSINTNSDVNYNLNFGLESSVTAGFVNLSNNTENNSTTCVDPAGNAPIDSNPYINYTANFPLDIDVSIPVTTDDKTNLIANNTEETIAPATEIKKELDIDRAESNITVDKTDETKTIASNYLNNFSAPVLSILDSTKSREKFSRQVYIDAIGTPTVGYGTSTNAGTVDLYLQNDSGEVKHIKKSSDIANYVGWSITNKTGTASDDEAEQLAEIQVAKTLTTKATIAQSKSQKLGMDWNSLSTKEQAGLIDLYYVGALGNIGVQTMQYKSENPNATSQDLWNYAYNKTSKLKNGNTAGIGWANRINTTISNMYDETSSWQQYNGKGAMYKNK